MSANLYNGKNVKAPGEGKEGVAKTLGLKDGLTWAMDTPRVLHHKQQQNKKKQKHAQPILGSHSKKLNHS